MQVCERQTKHVNTSLGPFQFTMPAGVAKPVSNPTPCISVSQANAADQTHFLDRETGRVTSRSHVCVNKQ